jgi:hypothetical protein
VIQEKLEFENDAEYCLHVIGNSSEHNVYRNHAAKAGILVGSFKMAFDVLISKRFML